MRDQGRLVEWFDDQGYGFIQPKDTSKARVFLHMKDFAKRGPRPIVGCALEYNVAVDGKGRFAAKSVVYLNAQQTRSQSATFEQFPQTQSSKLDKMTIAIIIYWLVLFTLDTMGKLPSAYFLLSIICSLATYFLYKKDKTAAVSGAWRVPEATLHLFSVLGGWSIAWFMQQKLRHKTQKQSFRQVYWLTVLLNIVLVVVVAAGKLTL
ncbi:DUF1294 domain-containing protein [Acinetobacter boissieri]|uniref:Uncharacterized membrane protein YsdA, DUF1294 family n=1 Tax=Acinetobacter boissieri TaxID=1219383 RepID=A0A1G6GIT5_9GAMM|nr:DUF1294 domain-containing protein [Acinetobacter boissieri]SDB81829.1 Uncharacterized membrane protein YsdA, DUF1294 family [Acinetobacter boissieri]